MPRLHSLCTEHAVISARRPRVFGNSAPAAAVTVQLAGQTAHATADASGHWRVEFPALPAGGPHTLIASDASGEVRARDILLGDVWLGSGQSNMEWQPSQVYLNLALGVMAVGLKPTISAAGRSG